MSKLLEGISSFVSGSSFALKGASLPLKHVKQCLCVILRVILGSKLIIKTFAAHPHVGLLFSPQDGNDWMAAAGALFLNYRGSSMIQSRDLIFSPSHSPRCVSYTFGLSTFTNHQDPLAISSLYNTHAYIHVGNLGGKEGTSLT